MRAEEVKQLERPTDDTLPLFAYGNLKHGELGHELIRSHVAEARPATITGTMWIADGSRGYQRQGHDPGSGSSIRIFGCVRRDLPIRTCRLLPVGNHDLRPDRGTQVNLLVSAPGLRRARDGGDVVHGPWSTADDPLFKHGLASVRTTLLADGPEPLGLVGDVAANWGHFYRLQAAFMLTCSLLERTTFRVVAEGGPTAAVNRLGRRDDFVAAVEQVQPQNYGRAVTRADDPG